MTMGFVSYPQETKDRAVEMYIDGKSAKEVADTVGCSLQAVLTWTREAGFDVRPKGGEVKAKDHATTPPAKNCQKDRKQINPLLLNLAGDNDLTPYIGKEIVKMTPREIFEFLELVGVEGEIVIKQRVKLRKKTPALPW